MTLNPVQGACNAACSLPVFGTHVLDGSTTATQCSTVNGNVYNLGPQHFILCLTRSPIQCTQTNDTDEGKKALYCVSQLNVRAEFLRALVHPYTGRGGVRP